MVLTAEAPVTIEQQVCLASAATWARQGHTVVETPMAALTGRADDGAKALVVGDPAIVECVLPQDPDPEAFGARLEYLAASGWNVTVLVDMARMGMAHQLLRGRPVALQAWWSDDADRIRFGGPEIP